MIKTQFRLSILFLALLISSGCGLSIPVSPGHYWTALEAYNKMKPALRAWHNDSVVISIASGFEKNRPAWCVQPDGKAPVWIFGVISPGALRGTSIVVQDSRVIVSPEGEESIGLLELQEIFTLERVITGTIDTDEAVNIALRDGAPPDFPIREISFSQFNSRAEKLGRYEHAEMDFCGYD